MAYNVSFKIRDDQVAFGDLIMDKNGAQLLSDIFIQAKQNSGFSPDNLNALWQIVNEWCFTDDEFVRLKTEFEQIKQDISRFKSLAPSLSVKWVSGIKELGATVDWIAGSATWVEKYKENKKIAASLYNELKQRGYQFTIDEQQVYDQRYRDVMNSCTQTELVREYLEREKREAMASGDPKANEKFVAAMLETGCFTKEQAEQHIKMSRIWDQAAGNGVQKRVASSSKESMITEEYTDSSKDASGSVPVTQAMLIDLWSRVNNIYDDPATKDSCAYLMRDIMQRVYNEAGIPSQVPQVKDPLDPFECAQNLMGILSMRQNQGLIDTAGIFISEDEYNKIRDLTFQVPGVETGVQEGYITATADLVSKWYDIISTSNDDSSIIKFCEILTNCLSVADIDYTEVINRPVNMYDKRSRMSGLVQLIKRQDEKFDDACPQVVYDKLDRILRSR